MSDLTAQQCRLLAAIAALTEERGYSPSVRDLMRRVGCSSTSTVAKGLSSLRRRGLVDWNPKCPRTLRVLKPPQAEAS